MAFFHRKLYRQKPKQWGPISAVQASFFRNAEKAGFDPNTFRGLFPMWEGAGNQLIDLGINSNHLSMNNYSWENQAVDFPGSSTQYAKNDTPIGVDGFKTGFVAGAIVNLDSYQQGSIFHHYITVDNNRCWFFENTSSTKLYCFLSKDGSGNYSDWITSYNPLTLGEDGHITLKWTSAPMVEFFFNGRYITTTNNITDANPVTNIKTPTVPIPLEIGRSTYNTSRALDGMFKFAYIIADCVTSEEQIAYLADNPYFLLHRQEPVFYSVPTTNINVYIGSTQIVKIYIGSTEITKIEWGVSQSGLYNDTISGLTINAVDGTAFIDGASALTSYADGTKTIEIEDSTGKVITAILDSQGTTEVVGTEIASGTLTANLLYKITATEVNHFGTGLAIGDYFTADGTETCDASNKVKVVLAPGTNGIVLKESI